MFLACHFLEGTHAVHCIALGAPDPMERPDGHLAPGASAGSSAPQPKANARGQRSGLCCVHHYPAMTCCISSSGTATIKFRALLRAAQHGSPAKHPNPKPPKQRRGQHGQDENLQALNLFRVHGLREPIRMSASLLRCLPRPASRSGRCRPALLRGEKRCSPGRQHQSAADGQEHQHLEQQQSNPQG